MKKFLSSILIIALVISITSANISNAAGYVPKNNNKAIALDKIGLFSSNSNGYNLDKPATRLDAAVMVAKLMEIGKYRNSMYFPHPFKDVPNWANSYVGYLYTKKIMGGVNATKFGSNGNFNSTQYIVLVLKALGYDDKKGDFKLNNPFDKASEIGLFSANEAKLLKNKKAFLKDDMVGITYNALRAYKKNSKLLLINSLILNTGISQKLAIENGLLDLDSVNAPIVVNKVNINGNIQGNTLVTEQDGWVYFLNPDDYMRLYKMKIGDTKVVKISNFRGYGPINVIGEYIYFRGSDREDKKNRIIKMKLNGSGISNLIDDEILTSPRSFTINNGWAYYTNVSDGVGVDKNQKLYSDLSKVPDKNDLFAIYGRPYKVKLDGTQKTKISDVGAEGISVIYDKFTYYDGVEDGINGLYRRDLNGSNLTPIFRGECQLHGVVEYNGYIYFEAGAPGYYKFIKCKPDGSEQSVLINNNRVYWHVVTDNCIFLQLSDGNGFVKASLYKMNLDGTGLTEIVHNEQIYFPSVVEGWLYYMTNNNGNGGDFIRIKVDGTNKQKLNGYTWNNL